MSDPSSRPEGQVLTRRIMGVETEYGIACTAGSRRLLMPDDAARYFFRPIVEQYSCSNIFTPNSSRLYLDVGSHPEVATPECDSVRQLLAYDRAGDRIVNSLAQQAEEAIAWERLAEKAGITADAAQVYLFRNNVDAIGNSYGCHENYLVHRSIILKELGLKLLPFLVTRQLLCGAGKIYRPFAGSPSEKYGPGFCFSQRADHVWEGVSSATTRSRPMINTRDEPHADSTRFRRLHVIVGDSNVAEPTTRLKISSTLLMLEMIEAGFPLPSFPLEDEVTAIRDVSHSLNGLAPLALKDGGTVTALDIQRSYFDAATAWAGQREGGIGEHAEALDLWGRVIQALDTGDLSLIDTEVDWAIKYSLFSRFVDGQGLAWDDPKLAQIDLRYHDIRPERSIAHALMRKGLIKTVLTEAEVEAAWKKAPPTTRARLRGAFLEAAAAHNAEITVDWTSIKLNRPEPRRVELLDPFATVDPAVDELLEQIRGSGTEGS